MNTINQTESYLAFKIGNEEFAINVSYVLHILELQPITKIPVAPDYLKGVINLRGSVLPVIDTRIKMKMSPVEFTENTCIIVLEFHLDGEPMKIGALVDSVSAVYEFSKSEIGDPPQIGDKYKSEFVIGMVKNNDKFIMLLDIINLIGNEDIIKLK